VTARAAACLRCDRVWDALGTPQCPWCGHPTELTDFTDSVLQSDTSFAFAPRVDAARAVRIARDAVREVPFAGPDLVQLPERLALVWLPRWRVSLDLDLRWEGLAGAELRSGQVTRRVELRVPASAGPLPPGEGEAGPATGPAMWASRPPSEQTHEVHAALRQRVAADQGVDDVVLGDVDVGAGTWVLEHLPAWVGWYRDDDGVVRTLVVDGLGGAFAGPRLASRQVATAWAGRQTIIGLAVLALAGLLAMVGVIVWLLLPGAAISGLVALWVLLSARSASPTVIRWNRATRLDEVATRA
jgi:hypothetical protein